MGEPADHAARDVPERSRFELRAQGRLAYADYRAEGGVLAIPYVYADPALRGSGAAGEVMEAVLAHACAQGLKVRPICPYAAAYIRRRREHAA